MPAPHGNDYGLKLKEPEMRKKAYEEYCAWLAQGKSSRSFTFQCYIVDDDGIVTEGKCTGKTIESYIKDHKEFPPLHKEFAFSQGYSKWEKVVEDSACGINKEANTASLQMLMRNKFDWDKKNEESIHAPKEENLDIKNQYYEALKTIQDLQAALNDLKPKASQELQRSDAPVQSVDRSGIVGQDLRQP